MKILHVIPYIAPRYGGPCQVIITLCRALQARGIDVQIATTNADGADTLQVPLEETISYRELPVIFFAREGGEALKYSPTFAKWINKAVKNYDLVHIHDVFSYCTIAAAKACRKNKVPYIVRPLGTLDPWSLRQKWFRKRVFWHLYVREMLIKSLAVHYTTIEERRLAEAALGLSNGVVIPNGLDLTQMIIDGEPQEQNPDADTAGPYILALSRIHPKKGFELLIKSFAHLCRSGAALDWRLVFAGDGEPGYLQQLKSLAAREGIAERVTFIGWLDGGRKQQILKQASLMALPSYQENFGNCLVEALAMGVPVVVSPHVNLASEIEAEGVGWIAPMSEDGLGSILEAAISNEEERRKRGERGHLYAQRFAAPSVAMKLQDLYASLI